MNVYYLYSDILGIWCLTPLSSIYQLYRGSQFYWWRKSEYLEKTTDLPQVSDKLYLVMLYLVHLFVSGFRTHNLSRVKQRQNRYPNTYIHDLLLSCLRTGA